MAAPTPVSSLVHSSTLVTAGIYLLIRFHSNFHFLVWKFEFVIGLLTILVARRCALIEWDSKKIVAFSTLRQLGLMVFGLGKKLLFCVYFHLLSHAIFKALMFIVIGYFLLKNFHFQDIRYLNKLSNFNFFLFFILFRRILSLSGFIFLVGFYRKDIIIEQFWFTKWIMIIVLIMRISLTVGYSVRLGFYLLQNNNGFCFNNVKINIRYTRVLILWILILVFGNFFSLCGIEKLLF